ncbi:MAG: 6-phosphofructokinase [Planctomycetota bacterium]|jgi:6-phosphofructokinase 1
MANKIKRIGVLTGGGDCPGLNAVIRAVTKTAMYEHGLEVYGIEDGYLGLIENRIYRLSEKNVSNILTLGGTILGTHNRCNPAKYKAPGDTEYRDYTSVCLENIRKQGLDAVVCIGGDGTISGAAHLVERGVNCVAVPKTIDNDVAGTEVTFGYASARHVATIALDRVHSTAASHHRAMIVEVMGRNAGWLALGAGLASGSDVILLPEIPYDIDKVCAAVEARSTRGKRFTILCVSEGAYPIGGKQVLKEEVEGWKQSSRLGGVGHVIADAIDEKTGIETRCTVLGHTQRGGSPVPEDRVLATRFGYHAVKTLMDGDEHRLVVMQDGDITDIDILHARDKQRLVPLDDMHIAAARGVGTEFGD